MKQSERPMILAEAKKIQARMERVGLDGVLVARQPIGGGNNSGLGAEFMDLDTIVANELEKEPLIYNLVPPGGAASGRYTALDQVLAKLDGSVNPPMVGFMELWSERPANAGKSRGEALSAWVQLPSVLAAANAAFLKLLK